MSPQPGKNDEHTRYIVDGSLLLTFMILAVFIGLIASFIGWQTGNAPAIVKPPPTTKPTSTVTTTPVIVTSGTTIGSPRAPITMVEYSDFQCGYCQHFSNILGPEIMETYVKTGKIRLVYKHLIGYGDESRLAAEAAECAAEQNLFWPYYEALMQSRFSSTKEDITVEKLYEIAEFVGLYVAQFDQSLASGKYKAKVSQDDVEGRSFGYNTIPMLFINGEKLEDKYIAGLEEFQKYMDEKLAEAGK